MDKALKLITKPESKSNTSPKGIKTLALVGLTPKTYLWLYFIKKSLLPTMHDVSISRDKVMIIYYIRRGIYMDVGCIIASPN